MDEQIPVEYKVGDNVRIYTGNIDGTMPAHPDYRATIEEVVGSIHFKLLDDHGERLTVHVWRLTKKPYNGDPNWEKVFLTDN